MTRQDEWVSGFRSHITTLLESLAEIRALTLEFNSLGYSGTLTSEQLSGQNPDVTPQQVYDALGTMAATESLLGAGHYTNLYRMKK